MSSAKKLLIAIIAILIVGGGYYAYNQHKEASAAAQPAMPPAAVTVKEIQSEDLPLIYEYAGRTAGSREVEIRPRVSGIILKRAYVEGQPVKEGDVLFKIDAAPFEAALQQAQARYAQANKAWARAVALRKQNAFSDNEFEVAQSTFKQAESELKTAQINLSYTTIAAPISGVTSKESLSEGSLVTADSSLLTRVSQLNPMYVDFSIPDSESLYQRQQVASGAISLPENKKLIAEIHLGDGSVYSQTGTVDFTDSIIDQQTGTVRARAVIENVGESLLPGQFVRVFVKGLVKKNAFVIPDQAVMQGPQGTFVYTVNAEGKAAIAPVTLGLLNGTNRIVESGLKAGDKVITEGMIKVRPDAPVKIEDKKADAAQASSGAPEKGEAKPEGKKE